MQKFLMIIFAVAVSASAFADTAPYVRFVATSGNDENDGRTALTPMATVKCAVRSLEEDAVENDCTVYVSPGTYELAADADYSWGIYLTNRISVVGISSNAADVVLTKASGESFHPLFYLDNTAASLHYLTLREGKTHNRWNHPDGYGGGAYVLHGVVEDCVFDGCANGEYGGDGGGICLWNDARASRCVIKNGVNYYEGCRGLAVYAKGDAVLEDSLIYNNQANKDEGSVYLSGNAVAVNCTIVNNSASEISGVAFGSTNARAVNTVIYGNTVSGNNYGDVGSSGCEAYLVNCLVRTDPVFRDYTGGDFRPVAGSPAIDAGAARGDYGCVSTTDLNGNPRAVDNVDVGCYENSKVGPECGFSWSSIGTGYPVQVALSADSYGVSSPTYEWCFSNELSGVTVAAEGKTYNWTPDVGTWKMTLSCGEMTYTSRQKLTVSTSVMFVKNGNPSAAFPYATEETAAADIATALEAASDGVTVKVLPGLYQINQQLVVDKAIRVIGTAGDRYSTVITNVVSATSRYAGEYRIFSLSHPEAFVANFTLAGGRVHQECVSGGCLYISAQGGTVSNCFLTGGITYTEYNSNNECAGAAHLAGGLLTHSEISECNTVKGPGTRGKDRVIKLLGGRISNCVIHDCTPTTFGVAVQEGRIIGAGTGTLIDNCTIVDCSVASGYPAIYAETVQENYEASAKIVNTAIFVTDTNGDPVGCSGDGSKWKTPWTGCYRYCAASVALTDGSTTAEGSVVAAPNVCYKHSSRSIYAPIAGSPLANAGDDEVAGLPSVDFAGMPRQHKNVDIGAYELGALGTVIIFR